MPQSVRWFISEYDFVQVVTIFSVCSKFALTAAHCLDLISPLETALVVGEHDITTGGWTMP